MVRITDKEIIELLVDTVDILDSVAKVAEASQGDIRQSEQEASDYLIQNLDSLKNQAYGMRRRLSEILNSKRYSIRDLRD